MFVVLLLIIVIQGGDQLYPAVDPSWSESPFPFWCEKKFYVHVYLAVIIAHLEQKNTTRHGELI